MIQASRLQVAYDRRVAVDQFDLEVGCGEIVALIGPNGSGKSTVLKTMARLLPASAGAVYLDGRAIQRLPTKEVARRLCILTQHPDSLTDLTVRQLVAYGRAPHQPWYRWQDPQAEQVIDWALNQTKLTDCAERPLQQLSGGERQRAWIAMALAQQPRILLLDEPTTFLDIGHQLEVMELLARLNQTLKLTILMVLHDLNQAIGYGQRVVVLQRGRKVAEGPPESVITAALLKQVYQVDAAIVHYGTPARPVVLPLGLAASAALGARKE